MPVAPAPVEPAPGARAATVVAPSAMLPDAGAGAPAIPAAIVPDSEHRGLMRLLPPRARDFASLARFDRPIGWWLLFWPGAWAVLLAGGGADGGGLSYGLLLLLLVGSIAMRGAGCVYNDIVDVEIDRRVARTAARPIAAGRVSRRAAWLWLLALCGVGLLVLLQLHWPARIVALFSLLLVAAYPFMKRITGWPQAWLGLVFTWAAPVGWVEARTGEVWDAHPLARLDLGALGLLYAGCWAWCVGYDTIYACQDREDDALVGVGSSALSFGRHVRAGVMGLYALALACWAGAFVAVAGVSWMPGTGVLWDRTLEPLIFLLPMALHLGWQALTLRPDDAGNVLARFRSNRLAGALMAVGCLVVGAVAY